MSTFSLNGESFKVASYNMGGIPIKTTYHPESPTVTSYDYLESIASHEVMKARYREESCELATLLRIQEVALQRLFADGDLRRRAEVEWEEGEYDRQVQELMDPVRNKPWYEQNAQRLTPFWDVQKAVLSDQPIDIRIMDEVMRKKLANFLSIEVESIEPGLEIDRLLLEKRKEIAKRLFGDELQDMDIFCLLEFNDFVDSPPLSAEYDVLYKKEKFITTAIAWKKTRFEFVQEVGKNKLIRAFSILLNDKLTGKTVVVGALHPAGCDPFTKNDSSLKGDHSLKEALEQMNAVKADIAVVGTDANVTPTHPRLGLFLNSGYKMDPTFFYPTATNPVDYVDTKIDYIAVKGGVIHNLPVPESIGLNSMRTNIGDHKPVIASISYQDE